MYGSSDPGYQGTLKRLTAQQQEWNAAATAAHKAAQTKAFMEGHEAKNNTADQAACIDELLWLMQKHPRLTENDRQLPFVIAVDRWSPGMMGRARVCAPWNEDLCARHVLLHDLIATPHALQRLLAVAWPVFRHLGLQRQHLLLMLDQAVQRLWVRGVAVDN